MSEFDRDSVDTFPALDLSLMDRRTGVVLSGTTGSDVCGVQSAD